MLTRQHTQHHTHHNTHRHPHSDNLEERDGRVEPHTKLSVGEVKALIHLLLNGGDDMRPFNLMLLGPPGIGKSEIVRQVCEELGLFCEVYMLNQIEPTDLKGLPMLSPDQQSVTYVKDRSLPRDPDARGVIFLDELNTAMNETQNAAMRLINERRIDDYMLPEGVMIIAAGNSADDLAMVSPLSSAMANRWTHLEVHAEPSEWLEYARERSVSPVITGFIQRHPNRLYHLEGGGQRGFATPRSWVILSELIAKLERSVDCGSRIMRALIIGSVGSETGSLFFDYYQNAHLHMSVEAFFESPEEPILIPPTRPELRIKLCKEMAVAFSERVGRAQSSGEGEWMERESVWVEGLFTRLDQLSETEVTMFVTELSRCSDSSTRAQLMRHPRFEALLERNSYSGLRAMGLSGQLLNELYHAELPERARELIDTLVSARSARGAC